MCFVVQEKKVGKIAVSVFRGLVMPGKIIAVRFNFMISGYHDSRKLISLSLILNVPPCDMLGNQLARNEILHSYNWAF